MIVHGKSIELLQCQPVNGPSTRPPFHSIFVGSAVVELTGVRMALATLPTAFESGAAGTNDPFETVSFDPPINPFIASPALPTTSFAPPTSPPIADVTFPAMALPVVFRNVPTAVPFNCSAIHVFDVFRKLPECSFVSFHAPDMNCPVLKTCFFTSSPDP